MTSDAQIQANRDNARHSTGPRTAEGKRRSRMNAVRHGAYLRYADPITAGLLDEMPDEIDQLYQAIIDDLSPSSALQYTQAAQIAQQIVNQQRVLRLTHSLAKADEVGTSLDESIGKVRHLHWCYEHLLWAVGSRNEPAAFELPYMALAKGLHAQHQHLGIDPPVRDLDAPDRLEADRVELLRIVEAVYGSLEEALLKLRDIRDELAPLAEAETRTVNGIEAHQLLRTFEKTTALHDRVARSITRDLKGYRDLKRLEAELDDEHTESPRNEPNPMTGDVPEFDKSVPDPMDPIV